MRMKQDRSQAAVRPARALRTAVNLGNVALARLDPGTGNLEGVSIELANALSKHVDRPLEFVTYPSAGNIVDTADEDVWDIAFLGLDPSREDRLIFSPAYAFLEATFIVRESVAHRSSGDLDVNGMRLSVTRNAAYELYLRHHFKYAELRHASTPREALERFVADGLDAAAGIRQSLDGFAAKNTGLRVFEGSFMLISQSIATQRRNASISIELERFIKRMHGSGFPEQMVIEANRSAVKLNHRFPET